MKLSLFVVISCLALHNGNGAPTTAVYKFVRCNPEGDQANCVTLQSPKMAWSPELPSKLPASTAQYLEAEPVEEGEEEALRPNEEGESPETVQSEDGSGSYEGSAAYLVADQAFESETGSGESWTEKDADLNQGGETMAMSGAKPTEEDLKEENLLEL
uniref:serglycin n=1 Tax=Scatophagus argus TaxID=75038 RepID=UPI001ED81574|nr:serglycin [Scatophagus argus]